VSATFEDQLGRVRAMAEGSRDLSEKDCAALRAVLAQLAAAEARLRFAAQALIEEVGADGPMSAEDAVLRAVRRLSEYRAQLATAERERDYWCAQAERAGKDNCALSRLRTTAESRTEKAERERDAAWAYINDLTHERDRLRAECKLAHTGLEAEAARLRGALEMARGGVRDALTRWVHDNTSGDIGPGSWDLFDCAIDAAFDAALAALEPYTKGGAP
jgi:hypothetical protein